MGFLTRSVSHAATLLIAGGTIGTKYAHRAFATPVEADSGDVLVTYRRGTREGSVDGSACLLIGTPDGSGGYTWGSEQTIVDGTMNDSIFTGTDPATPLPNGDRPSVRDVHIRKFASGRIALIFTSQPTGHIESSAGVYDGTHALRSWKTWFMFTDDDGATWSTPTLVPFTGLPAQYVQGVFGDDLIELPDGSLYVSGYAYNASTGLWSALGARSTDDGATWPYHATIASPIGGFNSVETSLAVLTDGTLYATFHTEDGVPTSIYATTLASPYTGSWATPSVVFSNVSNNRNSALQHPDGDLLQMYAAYPGLAQGVRQSTNAGTSFGSFISVFTVPSPYNNSDWIHGCEVGDPAITPNLFLVAAYERVDQSQANVYWATMSRGADIVPAVGYGDTVSAGYGDATAYTPPDEPEASFTIDPASTAWEQIDTSIIVRTTSDPSTVTATLVSENGGLVRFRGVDAPRFAVSLDGSTFASSADVEAGETEIHLRVTPVAPGTTLTAEIGVPV